MLTSPSKHFRLELFKVYEQDVRPEISAIPSALQGKTMRAWIKHECSFK